MEWVYLTKNYICGCIQLSGEGNKNKQNGVSCMNFIVVVLIGFVCMFVVCVVVGLIG